MRRLLPTLLLLAATAAPAAAAPALPLGHAGRWITDARGRVVVLHGLNMVYKRPPYAPDATGFGDDDAAFLAREGYDTVRVGVIYAAVEPSPGVYDDAYLDRIAGTVATLARHGIVSLLDFHQDMYNERFQGEGWPDWAVFDDGLPAEPKRGFSQNYLVMPALQHAYDNFFANVTGPGGVGILDRYAAAWRHVARRFRGNRHVLGYDLLNEPWPGVAWQDCVNPAGCPAADAKLAAFTATTLAAIRRADRRHLVFYEPYVLFDFGGGTSIGPFGDARAAFSFHSYCLQAGSSDSNDGCDTADELVFDHADAQAERTGDALLLTEFGATRRARRPHRDGPARRPPHGRLAGVALLRLRRPDDDRRGRQAGDRARPGAAAARRQPRHRPSCGSSRGPTPSRWPARRSPTASTTPPARSPCASARGGRTAAGASAPARAPRSCCRAGSTATATRCACAAAGCARGAAPACCGSPPAAGRARSP